MTISLLAAQGVPESLNLITLLHHHFSDSFLIDFLKRWDSIFFSLVVAIAISLFFHFGSRKKALIPGGLQNFLELLVESFRGVVVNIIGPDGDRFVPFLGTLFIYILSMNLIGLVPLMKSPSSSLNITIALAICVFVLVQYLNIKNMGIKGFLYHLAGSPNDLIGWLIAPLIFPIELLTQISRPITLALRLFGNIFGEKILIGFFAMASAAFFYFIPIQTPFMFLGILTGIMQAMVFTLLSTVYILLSVPHTDNHTNH